MIWLTAIAIGGTGLAAAQMPPELAPFHDKRDRIAAELARQVAFCSNRQDTGHPAFKGCVDWHSAVHGVWALVAYQRATGDAQYSSVVSSILNREALRAERAHLARSPQFEMPYGRAWFLRLAIDHHELTGTEDLLPFADEVALSLRDHYRAHGVDRFSGAYASDSWAMINLLDYARRRHSTELEAELVGWIRKGFVEAGPACGYERERGEFMAICTNIAALVSRVLDRDAYAVWLDGFIAANGLPSPVVRANDDHEYGLNFSRAWGLWDMYAASGRADVARCYAEHLDRGLTPATNWRGSYMAVGHWVAQFAMFALQPLFGAEKGR
ncbi:DUF2891 family protein [Bradyrhizobium sp.]|jgi:hypothetical protein|uniref:DUF2891 family protein n=1 Tax=Bradyrhizobium sp. TaxID=376 RepID=UPI002BC3A1A8|nr:DUF2891 family protein [Bradyrhizobium sp.]HWX59984.1 DUF2891 family protein [Bradyrhizobium sp.]